MLRISTITLVASAVLAACAPPEAAAPAARPVDGSLVIPPPPAVAPVTKAQTDYYRNAFPNAAHFVGKKIPPEMIRSLDKGNDHYVEARNIKGVLIGYLRDFSGPVTVGGGCECAPLNLTLAFDAQRTFVTIITAAPLTKLGHEPFTKPDLARLIQIVEDPPPALKGARGVDDIVDATTGATKSAYAASVVGSAGLTTKRVLDLARDTQRILRGAPLAWDRRRLEALLQQAGDDLALRAKALAAFIPTAGSTDVAIEAYRMMSHAYVEALRAGAAASRQVEMRLIDPKIDASLDGDAAVAACYDLLNAGVRLGTADRCATFQGHAGKKVDRAALARLSGSLLFLAGEYAAAVPTLEKAAQRFDLIRDPILHLRLARALAESGSAVAACRHARDLYAEHPLLPGVKKALASCSPKDGNTVAVIDELLAKQKRQLRAARMFPGIAAPAIPVEDDQMQGLDLPLSEPGKITVALFFATWCPHCRRELPQIVAFVRATNKQEKLRGKVRVIGVRTAVEKETETWETFVASFAPNFSIWTDPVMALAFSKFAKSQAITPTLPTLAVIDGAGRVRYLLRSGDYRDIGRELIWAVNDLLEDPDTAAPPATDASEGAATGTATTGGTLKDLPAAPPAGPNGTN